MGVIIDTSVLVDVERGRLSPDQVADAVGGEPVFATPVTIAEMQFGLKRAKTDAQRERRAAALAALKSKPCLVIGQATGEILGTLAASLDAAGRPARHRTHDLWIASLAIEHGHKVLTQDRGDFDDIPGLTVLTPPAPPGQPGSPSR